MKNQFRFKLNNIQLFGEPNQGGEPNPSGGEDKKITPKTYSEDEFKTLQAELEKQKKLKDQYSNEISEYKKKEKAKLTEDEKAKLQQEETQKEIERLNLELRKTYLSKEFLTMGFDDKTTEKIVSSYEANKDDIVKFVKELGLEVNKRIDSVRKEEQEKFNRGTPIPPNGGKPTTDSFDPAFQKLLDEKKKTSNNARDYYLGKGE